MASDDDILKKPLYVFDLPTQLLDNLQYTPEFNVFDDHNETTRESSHGRNGTSMPSEDEAMSKTSCALCNLTFPNYQEQRLHVRSDLHGYNTKLRMKGLRPVTDVEFEKLLIDLDESISGSENSDTETNSDTDGEEKVKPADSALSALLKKHVNIEPAEEDTSFTKKRKQGAGKPPLLWFKSPKLASNISLGIYRALLPRDQQSSEVELVQWMRKKQLGPEKKVEIDKADEDGGVKLPATSPGPHYFLCMIGGGHFAAMVVSLAPKKSSKHGSDERQASVLAHKTFHRYTTRRKQGGSQAANDSAKGAAHSAGSSLRRYNEAALTAEIRVLLSEWKDMIRTSELLFIRATGSTNRRTLFGPYDEQVLRQDDARIRGFPFSTRRATQAELMRCFVELTRVKVSQIDETALTAAHREPLNDADQELKRAQKSKSTSSKAAARPPPEAEIAALHTSQIEAMIRRSRAPALLSYLTSNSLSVNFALYPPDSQIHHHAPTLLHLASSLNAPAIISALLLKADADPTVKNAEGKTAFEIAGDRATRDAFRLARFEVGEEKWDWSGRAHVPEPLSKTEVEKRVEREKAESEAKEEARRKFDLEKLHENDRRRQEEMERNGERRRETKLGKGRSMLRDGRSVTAEEKRQEEARGMTPEMKLRMERERRARAAEERMKKTAGSGSNNG